MTGMQTGREVPVSGKSKVQFERNNLTDFSGSQRAYDALQAHLGLARQQAPEVLSTGSRVLHIGKIIRDSCQAPSEQTASIEGSKCCLMPFCSGL